MNTFSHPALKQYWGESHEDNEITHDMNATDDVLELLLPIDTPFEEQLIIENLYHSGFTWTESCRLLALRRFVITTQAHCS